MNLSGVAHILWPCGGTIGLACGHSGDPFVSHAVNDDNGIAVANVLEGNGDDDDDDCRYLPSAVV